MRWPATAIRLSQTALVGVSALLRAVFTCNHSRLPFEEGKAWCPDCGCAVVLRWAVLVCRGCSGRRPASYRLRSIVAADPCCAACGETACLLQHLENPPFYVLPKAVIHIQPEAEYLAEVSPWDLLRPRPRPRSRAATPVLLQAPAA